MLDYSVLNLKREIHSDYLGENIWNMLDYSFTIPKDFSYNVFKVSQEYIARPDLVSLDAYGDTMYTDIICKLNGLSNPFELNEGMKLIVPTPDYITQFIIEPSIRDKDANWGPNMGDSKSTAKSKKQKRQANEAIMGNSRFKIDKTNGVIIY